MAQGDGFHLVLLVTGVGIAEDIDLVDLVACEHGLYAGLRVQKRVAVNDTVFIPYGKMPFWQNVFHGAQRSQKNIPGHGIVSSHIYGV